ncbi:hypothetical protein DPMN_173057 [Dreissena polymorpha]|uniref:Helicase C-terminal domain-containing protein n=1 Tax=Dreissena polymorpha TaxID=45954 RepID=A0A9D4E0W5_DREPO|nr:hypothetical protein DPMN_173057 [Dreissena polymorpha]
MTPEVMSVTEQFMLNTLRILVKKELLTLTGKRERRPGFKSLSRHEVSLVGRHHTGQEWKFETLCDLNYSVCVNQAVIFCNSRRKVVQLTREMNDANFTVSAIHGDLDQKDRDVIMRKFRTGSSRLLITTNLLARGIDVQQVSLVINYDVPRDRESYLHRIGRSGRFGRKGVAINFMTQQEGRLIRISSSFTTRKSGRCPETSPTTSARCSLT